MRSVSGSGWIGKVMWMTASSRDIRQLNRVAAKVLSGMKPPENLTVTQWAECKRYLSTEASAEPGLWRTSRTPYLRAIMDAFSDPKVRHIVFVAASQVGKTEVINNMLGYIIDQNPGSILFVHPTTIDAREFSKLRIAPMIRDSPALRRKISAPKSRDSGNTLLQKTYPGGILTLCGSNEAHALASKPIRYVFGDERDRWAQSAGTEGDPWELAMARQTTFYNAKAVEVSTPTIKGASPIVDSYNEGTMERWKSQCPHCGEFHEIQWKNIRYEAKETVVNHERTYTIEGDVLWCCPGCACTSNEATMKKQPAQWVADNPAAYANGVRSFWLNAFVSPWASWASICLKYQNALGDTNKMQVVYNTCFGQLWENRGDTQDPDTLLGRRDVYDAELPEGVLALTAGVDTQDDRFEYEIVGYGHFGETWGIEYGIIMGSPDRPFTEKPKKMKIIVNNRYLGTCWQYQIGVDAGKQMVMDNLRVETPGPNYCHFPLRDDYGHAYFHGLLSEHLVPEGKTRQRWIWSKIPGHERNEPLDCRNYALAAFRTLPVNLDAKDRQLKKARGKAVDAPPAAEPAPARPKPKKKDALDRYFNEW